MPRERPGPDAQSIKSKRVAWSKAWRIIASRYPPIHLFERLSNNPPVWDALIALEGATNPRVRDEVGEINLVPGNRRVVGPNASYVMAPFTHVNPKGSRFSNGTYGVYYAASSLETAIHETAYHFARIAADAKDSLRREDMRVLVGTIDHMFDDANSLEETLKAAILDRNSYALSQRFGGERRAKESEGILYPSVRHRDGNCLAAFWPNVVSIPVQERHLKYEWDGSKMTRYFDYQSEKWIAFE
jgi:RES domain-containing protein